MYSRTVKRLRGRSKAKNPVKILKEGLYAVRVLRLKKTALVRRIKQIADGIIVSTRNEHSVLLSRYGQKHVLKIAQLHHDHCFDKRLLADVKKRYDNITYFTLLTDVLTQEMQQLLSDAGKHTRCVTMENFLDADARSVELANKEKYVVAVGRLHPVKGFDRLLRVWKDTAAAHPDWTLRIVGGGEEEQALAALANELGVQDRVEFTGALAHDEVLEQMTNASVYAMTSYSEGFPFVLIEAMSCGLPVVAFDVRVGPRAIIRDGVDGVLVKDHDEAAFCKALSTLMDNEEQRVQYSQKALERAEDFSEEKIVSKWMALFEQQV